ncbi:MAG: hypothetical protein H7Y86_04455 [Rhizobacter sp.]|nr:hypothetical protein [Ferruginibacter sp.]
MKEFRLDKTVFKARSFEDAEKDKLFSPDTPIADRLKMAFHLSFEIFGLKDGDSLKIDRKIFSARKFS